MLHFMTHGKLSLDIYLLPPRSMLANIPPYISLLLSMTLYKSYRAKLIIGSLSLYAFYFVSERLSITACKDVHLGLKFLHTTSCI